MPQRENGKGSLGRLVWSPGVFADVVRRRRRLSDHVAVAVAVNVADDDYDHDHLDDCFLCGASRFVDRSREPV